MHPSAALQLVHPSAERDLAAAEVAASEARAQLFEASSASQTVSRYPRCLAG